MLKLAVKGYVLVHIYTLFSHLEFTSEPLSNPVYIRPETIAGKMERFNIYLVGVVAVGGGGKGYTSR